MEKKVESANKFDSLAGVVPGRETWRIKVRVLRMWRVLAFFNPTDTNSIEMVLVDEKVLLCIQRNCLVYLFFFY